MPVQSRFTAAVAPELAGCDILHGFRFDAESAVFVPACGLPDFEYSDGEEIETRLASAIDNAVDVSLGSLELSRSIIDFPSQYHLSPERANLLRPVADFLRGRVFEIGAGCGAVTRFLGENGGDIYALEGSLRRARICRRRCRDLSNVTVLAGNMRELAPIRPSFDAVVLIGVLEYSRMYLGGPEGPANMLRRCRALLRPGGVLLLAIENQLGLKYFCGAPEDHLAIPYAGVQDQYGPRTQVTFGRNELKRLLHESGFEHFEFLYPFPDYKFARAIFPEAAFKKYDVNVASVLRMMGAPGQGAEHWRSFSEEMAWPVILRNGLAEDLANSFLILASARKIDAIGVRRPVSMYATSRRRCFAKCISFDPLGEDAEVKRTPLYLEQPQPDPQYEYRLETEPLYRGRLLGESFLEVLNRPGWTAEDLAACCGPWLDYLRRRVIATERLRGEWLPGDFVDCTPFNLVVDASGDLHRFDQEWVSKEIIPVSFVLFRGVLDVLLRPRSFASPGRLPSTRLLDIVERVLTCVGAIEDRRDIADALDREARLHDFVYGSGAIIRAAYPALLLPAPRAGDAAREGQLYKGLAVDGERRAAEAARVLEEETSRQREAIRILEEANQRYAAERGEALARVDVLERELAAVRLHTRHVERRLEEVLKSRTWRWGSRIARWMALLRPAM
ncbi:MAG TPA: class I SAM-dependent methyltransferase [Bryobacteraceae bacterium]|nr:class I SAM-dependent methyltransferase [Bryobacteraceae bacterium]